MHTRSRISGSQSKIEPLETKSEPISAGEIQWPVRKARISKRESKTRTALPVDFNVDLDHTTSHSYALTQHSLPGNGGMGSIAEGTTGKDQDPCIENRPNKRKTPVTTILEVSSPVNPSIESVKVKPAAKRKSRKSSPTGPDIPITDKSKSAPSPEATGDNGMDDSPAKITKARAKPIEPGSLQPPPGWREIYDLTLELRKERDAPVDWAGSESLGVDPVTGVLDKYHVLIALMLSSQTKDQVVAEAMAALRGKGLSVDAVLGMSDAELNACIGKVGFHNNKTRFIKAATAILKERHAGAVPATAEELCQLPGVGPKMAYIVLRVAHGVVAGIGVDTHMHRIFNQLAWVKSSTPEKTREQLEGWLPREEWGAVNVLFVGLGQMVQQPPERAKLLRRCVDSAQPAAALRYVARLGADVNSRDAEGGTCLMYAVRRGRADAVAALVARPLSVRRDVKAPDGRTARDMALDMGRDDLAALLGA